MNRPSRVAALFFLVLSSLWSKAQDTTGTIFGSVQDASGAAVVGATVQIASSQTGLTRSTTTSLDGEYRFSLVPVGVYSVSSEKAGFKKQLTVGITVEILSTSKVNFALSLGEVSETVSVNADEAQLDTETSEAGTVIKGEQINSLPLNVRQFMQLIFLAPMATPATGDFRSTEVARDTSVPAAAGQRPEQNNYQIDGIDNRESGRNGFAISPPVDSVGEFRVQTGLAPAEFGRGGGAIINVVTRSGTNRYHGAAYEFIRNNIFDSKPYFATKTSPLKRNQFGGAFGGPVLRDKLFFFGNYEGLRQAATGNPPIGLVPTVSQKSGVFSTPIKDPANGFVPFANNTIPDSRINPISRKLLALFPDPNNADPARNFLFSSVPSGHENRDAFVSRMDWNASNKDDIYGRYLFDQEITTTSPTLPAPALSAGRSIHLRAQGASIAWSHVMSPTLANSFSIGYTRFHNTLGTLNSYRQDFVTTSGITNTLSASNPLFWGVPNLAIPGLLTPTDVTPSYRTMNEYQVLESVVMTRGHHTIKAGGDVQQLRTNMFYTGANGTWSFSNAYTGNAFADFLLGDASSVAKTARATQWNTKVWYLAGFLQDDWKLTKKLVLNLGLRYEVESAIDMSDKCGLGMDLSTGTEIVSKSCTDLSAIQAFSVTTRPDVLLSTTDHTAPYDADTNNVAPRFGFAYSATPKTVVRGGYGIFYDAPQIQSTASSNDFAPDTLRPTWTSSPTNPTYSWNPEGTSSAESSLKTAALTVYPFLTRHFPYGVVQEWNTNVQRQLTKSLTLEVMYQGSKADHLLLFDNSDTRAPGPGAVQAQLPFPQYARIQNFAMWGASRYNGMSVKLDQKAWHDFTYLLSYTYSRSIDNASTLNQIAQWTDPFNKARTARGPSDFNAPHRFSAAYSYNLPFGIGKKFLNGSTWTDKFVGGWGVRGITSLQSGLPQSPSMNLSRVGICASSCSARPDRIGNGNLSGSAQTLNHYYDVKAFQVLPAAGVSGRIGNAGRNILTSPGVNNTDLQVFKKTSFHESQSVEFRWELFNAFNHTQWGAPSVDMESPSTFGTITSTRDPRIMQFVLRYAF